MIASQQQRKDDSHQIMPDPTFATSLLTGECHLSVVNLGEGEIKTIENFKAYLAKQVNLIEQYLHAIQKLNSSSDIAKFGLDGDSPFVKVNVFLKSKNYTVFDRLVTSVYIGNCS